ncbi:NADPH:quinone reductase-like Zn-dependent oxidoreductase [Paraburkholderia sp. BL18I3N2]|uniref:zinc-binding dehydrogenase n=1 Tax=Paraburkholderia sp. BL18I3N2 TaxID=1938799 RepID=UPI000D04ABD2|nr:zinc-binding dehydrogenase [Paraburkholderia sp. BL18I3N2]PRX22334.1 NADPH:quinone reductase-like Zn-dependent oxidoreductase [Paraburkholderia sp. BL18I3N2]
MKAVMRNGFGGPEVLKVVEVPEPSVKPGCILVRVRAFGLNRAELYMRQGLWGAVAEISGIECVGTVVSDTTGVHREGQTVMALMGGMGRTINGSYAEYVAAPASNVVAIETTLGWDILAALPETYAVGWTCLHRNLELKAGQRLVVRGGTSALGQAAIDIARELGADVIATTRRSGNETLLRSLGAAHVVTTTGDLLAASDWPGGKADAVLDLVGNSTVLDSLRATRRGGRVCLAGFLGGLAPLTGFNPLGQMPSGVHMSFFGSFDFGIPEFPLSDVPMQQIVDFAAMNQYRGRPTRVFSLSDVPMAHQLMERNEAKGKFVVVI